MREAVHGDDPQTMLSRDELVASGTEPLTVPCRCCRNVLPFLQPILPFVLYLISLISSKRELGNVCVYKRLG